MEILVPKKQNKIDIHLDQDNFNMRKMHHVHFNVSVAEYSNFKFNKRSNEPLVIFLLLSLAMFRWH